MQIDFTKPLTDLKGEQLKDAANAPLVLSDICTNALMATFADETNLSGVKKFERFKLAERVSKGSADCSAEEIALMKELVGKGYGPAVVGPVYKLLDPVA